MANETPAQPAPAPAAPAAASSAPASPAAEPTGPAPASAAAQQAALKAKKALSGLKRLGLWSQIGEIFRDLLSTDLKTRRVARYFLLSVLGVAGVLIASGVHLKRLQDQVAARLSNTGEQGKNLGDFIAKEAAEARRKFSIQPLGSFTVEIKPPDGQARKPPGVMNLADIEIVVQCDSKATCDFVEDRMPQIRNLVTDVLVPMDRDALLSREGKRQLKKRIIDKLNGWLPRGKIQDLYFDKLVVS